MTKLLFICSLLLLPCNTWCQSPLLFVYNEYPPYEYETTTGHVGISTEKIKKAAADAGIAVRFKHYPWSRAL